ncbi:MAG: hypothetical protein ACKVUS_04490 [Saprospiraceae bacterium]
MRLNKHTIALLALTLLCTFSQTAAAQNRRQREQDRERERERARERDLEKEDEKESAPKDFKSRLWYGSGLNLRFGGVNGSSVFVIGIAPMVGYKIVGPLSAGPRVAFDFTSYKRRGFKAVGLTSVDAGAFVRCRVFRGLFLQGEVSNQWYQDLNLITNEKINEQRVNQRLGAGWNFGEPGGTGSEISILYNFNIANDIESGDSPIEYRFGFTWKF